MTKKISEVKAHLSAILAQVRRGETVTVLDRQVPVARIVPIDQSDCTLQIQPATRAKAGLAAIRTVRLKPQTRVNELLRESRDQR
jgi:prevent-host-death family protein